MTKKIAIMGCGWLGLPLAEQLIKDGHTIHGSTTSEEKTGKLKEKGIHPFLISLSEDGIQGDASGFLEDMDALVINVPPGLRSGKKENYVKKMQHLHREIKASSVRKVIFVSSTSVYGDAEGEVTEQTPPAPVSESGRQLVASEKIFRQDADLKATIIRFGGLIGPDRHPITMLSGKQNLSNGNAPINLIHLTDCIRIITEILHKNWWNETFNGVYPQHPTKQDYYTETAIRKGLQPPEYVINRPKFGKKVLSYNLTNVKKFGFTTSL
ncbi:MAG: SDR family oxidoreductase [Pricia sp.]